MKAATLRPELWLSRGLDHATRRRLAGPLYWHMRILPTRVPAVSRLHSTAIVPLEDPRRDPVCHLSFFEADAYARFAGHRLLSSLRGNTLGGGGGGGGKTRPPIAAELKATKSFSNPTTSTLPRPQLPRPSANGSATYGSGLPPRLHSGYPGYKPLPRVSERTTANSCFLAGSSSRWLLRHSRCLTSALPIATSSPPPPAGSSPASAFAQDANHPAWGIAFASLENPSAEPLGNLPVPLCHVSVVSSPPTPRGEPRPFCGRASRSI